VRENDLDTLKKEVIKRLPKGIFTPVPRQELAALVHEQDQVANNCMELTGRMVSRPIPIPEPLQKAFREYILVSVKAVKGVSGYVHKMDELITTGFQGPPAHEVATGLAKLENLEDTIPEMTFRLRRAVFEVEKTLDPVHAMFLYRVVDRQEELIRNIFDVGDQLATMVTS
jgi:predicted phosphate transport protein (TIGR00153 family)